LDRGHPQGVGLPAANRHLLAGAGVARVLERLGREHDLARPRELLGSTCLGDRRPTDDEFPATQLTT
jgi:hypothetical protein